MRDSPESDRREVLFLLIRRFRCYIKSVNSLNPATTIISHGGIAMRLFIVLSLISVAIVFVIGCSKEYDSPVETTTDDGSMAAYRLIEEEIASSLSSGGDGNRNSIAILSGDEEVPPRKTHGRGVAKFKVSKDGTSIHYKLIVANISNVVAAHVHRAGVGLNGPVAFGLYSAAAGGGRIQGPIAEGDFTAADLVGPYAGSTDLSLFIADLHADSLYVNVHTNDGVDPPNTGRGDFPGGEIRGQIK